MRSNIAGTGPSLLRVQRYYVPTSNICHSPVIALSLQMSMTRMTCYMTYTHDTEPCESRFHLQGPVLSANLKPVVLQEPNELKSPSRAVPLLLPSDTLHCELHSKDTHDESG